MDVKNHRLDDIWYEQTSNLSAGTITPRFIVTHYTTGWSGSGSRDWLLGRNGGHPSSEVSAHVVIDRDGTAWQIAPFNRKAWHAGPSRFGSVTGLNGHSIGLEFVNPGWLKRISGGRWADGYGHVRTEKQLDDFGGFELHRHPRVGGDEYAWPLFTDKQVATGIAICRALIRKYAIKDVVTHEEIDTRGWKTDPGPSFRQQMFRDLLLESGLPDEAAIYEVDATRLNIRGGPGLDYETIDPPGSLPDGTRVEEKWQQGVWRYVEVVSPPHDGIKGWVHGNYLNRVFEPS